MNRPSAPLGAPAALPPCPPRGGQVLRHARLRDGARDAAQRVPGQAGLRRHDGLQVGHLIRHFGLWTIFDGIMLLGNMQYRSFFPRRSQGFEDNHLDSSLGWWADTAATYCPDRLSQLVVKPMTKHQDRREKNALYIIELR